MKTAVKRLFFSAEDLLERTLAAARLFFATWAARWRLRHKSDLRGRSCHCPPAQPLHLVHSEGLRETADVVVDFGSNVQCPQRPQIPVGALATVAHEINDGDIVHVKADLLGQFLTKVFPHLRVSIVLVTGDSDFAPVRAHEYLLRDPRIIHWFAQNCDVDYRHARLTRIPIGIDNPRYTKLEKRIGFAIEMVLGKTAFDPTATRNDMGDQARLQQIAAVVNRDVHAKPARVLCTFHMNQKLVPNFSELPDRREAYEQLQHHPWCHFVPHRLPQDECWRLHADFAFEVSPRGRGLDCFRTWESLALGTIPIVKTTSLDPLYHDEALPVVIVDSFREITPANLARWQASHADKFTRDLTRKLSNDYWTERIRAASTAWIDARR